MPNQTTSRTGETPLGNARGLRRGLGGGSAVPAACRQQRGRGWPGPCGTASSGSPPTEARPRVGAGLPAWPWADQRRGHRTWAGLYRTAQIRANQRRHEFELSPIIRRRARETRMTPRRNVIRRSILRRRGRRHRVAGWYLAWRRCWCTCRWCRRSLACTRRSPLNPSQPTAAASPSSIRTRQGRRKVVLIRESEMNLSNDIIGQSWTRYFWMLMQIWMGK